MAKGDFTLFNSFAQNIADKVHDIKDTNVLKLGLITDAITPTADYGNPYWTSYLGEEEVTGAGYGYASGGHVLTWDAATRWALVSGVGTLDADDITFAQNASGFTDARWGILYDDTATSDPAIGFLDLGGDVSQVTGAVTIAWSASGILTITVNPA
jgi:hypothetical protein